MNYLKLLFVAVVTTVATTAFVANASATTATSPAGTVYTGTLRGLGSASFHGPFTTIKCEEELEGIIESHGSAVTGKGRSTKWENRKCNFPVESLATGTIEIHKTGAGMGTITSTGTKGRVETSVGVCIYQTFSTDLGTITDSSLTKGTATIDLSGTIPRVEGNFLCGSSATLTGSATVTIPDQIFID
jgi:hypothetical protein